MNFYLNLMSIEIQVRYNNNNEVCDGRKGKTLNIINKNY